MLIQLADEDCLYACKELGFSYANEINRFEKDHKKAAKYLKIAAQSGDKACDIELDIYIHLESLETIMFLKQ